MRYGVHHVSLGCGVFLMLAIVGLKCQHKWPQQHKLPFVELKIE